MRRVTKNIYLYLNFNASPFVEVKKLHLQDSTVAGLTCYHEAHNCSHFLEEPTITLVLEGEKYMLINKTEYFLKPGDLLFIPKHSVVFTDIPEAKNSFRSFNLVLSDAVVRRLYELSPKKECSFNTTVLKTKHSPFLIKEVRKISAVGQPEEKDHKPLFLKLLEPIRKELFEVRLVSKKTRPVEPINKVLLQSLNQPVSLPKMASDSAMSLATFKRHFKSLYGVSPKAWVRDQRLQAAYFHLKTNKENIATIVSQLGFDSFSHFSYLFKKTFRITPSSLTAQN